MASLQFYLCGDDISTAQSFQVDPSWRIEDLKKALGQVFHIAQPSGISFHSPNNDLVTVQDILEAIDPISLRIDGQPVQSPQGPTGLPIVGSFYEIFPDHLGNHYRLFRKYGGVIKTTNMGKTTYLTDDPDVTALAMAESAYFTKKINSDHPLFGVKDNTAIFVGDTETENWRIAHKFIPPALGPKAVRHYAPVMQECGRKSFAVFDELDGKGEAWNAYQFMLKLASQAIGKFSLGMDFGHFESVESKLNPMVVSIATMLSLNKKVTSRGEWYRYLPFGDPARLRESQRETYHHLQHAIDNAPTAGIEGMSLNEAAVKASCVADYLLNAVDEKGEKFPRGLILANMIVVAGAGYTTTSSLLSWILYSLVTYPGVQDKLLQELVDFGVSDETEFTPELAHSMPYLDKVVKETQRLHNASFQPGRTTKTEVIVPGGYRLPADSVIVPALYAIHTNPAHWRDPFRFDPERWDTEEVKNRHRCAYVPFATGPRGCIGFNFALLEIKILLSMLVFRYEFVREGVEAVEYDPEFQLIRPLNLYVRAKRRTTWPAKTTN